MDNKTFSIGILSLTGLVLVVANCLVPPKASAELSITGHGYSVVTAKVQNGGDAVYILENQTGRLAVFTYDNGSRRLEPRTVRPLTDAFITRP
ncbi:MAG TPA: hypothetical protein VGR35_08145 [Tepidisphaeraceae bacterium]|nr:hypothetical protein [Tepidisphaeraceae bacterium]